MINTDATETTPEMMNTPHVRAVIEADNAYWRAYHANDVDAMIVAEAVMDSLKEKYADCY